MKRTSGFTLIELMVTVAIIAILAAIAIPSYTDYVRRGRITEAIATLSSFRVKMEQYFQDNRSYAGACQVAPPITVANKPVDTTIWAYTCNPAAPLANAYVVQATGVAGGPMEGFQYTLDQTNLHTTLALPAGWNNPGCGWVLKRDGSC